MFLSKILKVFLIFSFLISMSCYATPNEVTDLNELDRISAENQSLGEGISPDDSDSSLKVDIKCDFDIAVIFSKKKWDEAVKLADECITEKNVDCVVDDKKKETPLLIASKMGKQKIVKYLLDKKAKKQGSLALKAAIKRGSVEVLSVLLENGIDFDKEHTFDQALDETLRSDGILNFKIFRKLIGIKNGDKNFLKKISDRISNINLTEKSLFQTDEEISDSKKISNTLKKKSSPQSLKQVSQKLNQNISILSQFKKLLEHYEVILEPSEDQDIGTPRGNHFTPPREKRTPTRDDLREEISTFEDLERSPCYAIVNEKFESDSYRNQINRMRCIHDYEYCDSYYNLNNFKEYVESLTQDPAHKNDEDLKQRTLSILEAWAGLCAVAKDYIPGPIIRGPKEIEFYDGDGYPVDIKTPQDIHWTKDSENGNSHAGNLFSSCYNQLRMNSTHLFTGKSTTVKTIANVTFISEKKRRELHDIMKIQQKGFGFIWSNNSEFPPELRPYYFEIGSTLKEWVQKKRERKPVSDDIRLSISTGGRHSLNFN